MTAPLLPQTEGCSSCAGAATAGYADYSGDVASDYYGGEVIADTGSGYYSGGDVYGGVVEGTIYPETVYGDATITPPMTSVAPGT